MLDGEYYACGVVKEVVLWRCGRGDLKLHVIFIDDFISLFLRNVLRSCVFFFFVDLDVEMQMLFCKLFMSSNFFCCR